MHTSSQRSDLVCVRARGPAMRACCADAFALALQALIHSLALSLPLPPSWRLSITPTSTTTAECRGRSSLLRKATSTRVGSTRWTPTATARSRAASTMHTTASTLGPLLSTSTLSASLRVPCVLSCARVCVFACTCACACICVCARTCGNRMVDSTPFAREVSGLIAFVRWRIGSVLVSA